MAIKEIFITLCSDRHIDTEVFVFKSLDDAIARAKIFIADNARYLNDIEEEKIEGCEFYCRYSAEGDDVRVTKGILQ